MNEKEIKKTYYNKIISTGYPDSNLTPAERVERYELALWVNDSRYVDDQGRLATRLTKEDFEKKGLPSFLYEEYAEGFKYSNEAYDGDYNIKGRIQAKTEMQDRYNKIQRPLFVVELEKAQKALAAEQKTQAAEQNEKKQPHE